MVSLTALLSEAAERTDRTLPLAAVPMVVSLLALDRLRRVTRFDGFNLGISFGFPSTVSTGWTFLSLPSGPSGPTVTPTDPGVFTLVSAVGTLLTAALGAGYLGSLRRAVAGESRQFLADVRAHFLPLLLLQVGVFLAGLLFVGAALVTPLLLVLVLPLLLVVAYLFYAAPYLVVTGDRSLMSALRASYRYATAGGPYASFFARYLLVVALVSIPATPPFTSLGLVGALVGMVLLAPVGLLFDDATMSFLRDLDGGAPGVAASEDDEPPVPAIRRVEDDGGEDGRETPGG
jgi:hypothetical protein